MNWLIGAGLLLAITVGSLAVTCGLLWLALRDLLREAKDDNVVIHLRGTKR